MVETERIGFTVTTTGQGRPDYSPQVLVGRTVVDPLQNAWDETSSIDNLPAESSYELVTYTVPTGYKLTLASGQISCDGSLIQRMVMLPGIIGSLWYDLFSLINFGPTGAVVLDAGQILRIIVYNMDDVPRSIQVWLSGFLQKVE